MEEELHDPDHDHQHHLQQQQHPEEQEREQQEDQQEEEHQRGKEKEQQQEAVRERKSGEGGTWGLLSSSCCCTSRMREGEQEGTKKNMGSDGDDDITGGELLGVVNADEHPEHLVILVNGIIGSPDDWIYAAKRLNDLLGRRVAIHCSVASTRKKTFDGVDIMGKRLAEEVRDVIGKTHGVKKISFLAHSLGGLISRYAISQLYHSPSQNFSEGVTDPHINSQVMTEAAQAEPTIGGLQAENFITLATPHLGCRGAKQLPILLGIEALEKTASFFAHWFIGNTGKHLFLADGSSPLLKKMATDCKEGKFISSLRAFKRRTVYANVANDRLVGWGTASIRRKSELDKIERELQDPSHSQRKDKQRDPYPHIVREEEPSVGTPNVQAEDLLEEAMVSGLTQVSWHRVDVSFRGAKMSYQAHNLMQVKNESMHSAGKDVIEHVIAKQFANY